MVSSHETQAQEDDPHTIRLEFDPALYQCFENCGSLKLTVARNGGDPGVTAKVCFLTISEIFYMLLFFCCPGSYVQL